MNHHEKSFGGDGHAAGLGRRLPVERVEQGLRPPGSGTGVTGVLLYHSVSNRCPVQTGQRSPGGWQHNPGPARLVGGPLPASPPRPPLHSWLQNS